MKKRRHAADAAHAGKSVPKRQFRWRRTGKVFSIQRLTVAFVPIAGNAGMCALQTIMAPVEELSGRIKILWTGTFIWEGRPGMKG